MGDLTNADVVAYTGGRLPDNADTQRILDAALDAARTYCGWHVTPVQTDTLILDGPGAALLVLPTLALIDLVEVIENDVTLDLTDLNWSNRGLVRKKRTTELYWTSGVGGYWTGLFGGIQVTMDHGFDETPWFDSAVLAYIDRTATTIASGGGGQRTNVGPFAYAVPTLAEYSSFTCEEQMILDKYKLEWMP